MSAVSEATTPTAVMPTLEPLAVAPNSPAQTQTPPAVTENPPAVSQSPAAVSLTPELEAPSLKPAASQPLPDDQMCMANSAEASTDTAAVFGAINSTPPTLQSIPPGAIILRHMGNTASTWMKRRRGQPRKFGLFRSDMHQPQQSFSPQAMPLPPPVRPESQPPVGGSVPLTDKKAKGRPPSSSKKQKVEALGSSGVDFIPHVIDVQAGEDVSSKIMAFSQNCSRDVCILSVSGAISNVTIRQPATSGGTATYEGWFDIVALSGSFMLSKFGSHKRRTGGLSIQLAGPDGMVLGGSVAGLLVAASPVQVIIGSYEDGPKETKSAKLVEPSSAPPKFNYGGDAGASSSQLLGTLGESSGGVASTHNLSSEAQNNPLCMPGMP